MEMNFNMSAQDYYAASQARNRKVNDTKKKNALSAIMTVLCILILTALAVFTKDYLYVGTYAVIFAAIIIFKTVSAKKNIMKTYDESPIAQSMHTIRTYSDGLEIINSYEKMFIPWKSIYMVENTADYLVIMPTFAKGAYAVNKHRFASPQLDGIIAEINSGRGNV